MQKTRIAVVGAGRIGKMHIANIQRELPEFTIVGVCDPNPDRQWLNQHGVSVIHESLNELLEQVAVDAVLVASPTNKHSEHVGLAAHYGKHIFCEKPVASDLAVLTQIKQELSRHGVRLMVGLNRRFDPHYAQAKSEFKAGKIGKPYMIKIVNRDPSRPRLEFAKDSGGLFFDFTIHDFDLVHFISESKVAEIYAQGSVLIDPRLAELDDIDTALITIKLANGALCSIDNSREAVYGYDQRLEIFGEKGSIVVDNAFPSILVRRLAEASIHDNPFHHFSTRYREAYCQELRCFQRGLVEASPFPTSIDDMIAAVRVAQAAQRSLREKRPVSLDHDA